MSDQLLKQPRAPHSQTMRFATRFRQIEATHDELARSLVRRARLVNQIERPYQAAVTIILGGAGYGKTSLALEWAKQTSKFVRWLPLSPADNEFNHFRAILNATLWAASKPSDGALSALLLPVQIAEDMDALLFDLAANERKICLVIDNFHYLTDPGCLGFLNELIARRPANLSVMLLSRRAIPLTLGRLRGMGDVREIGPDDLRFTESEAFSVLGGLGEPDQFDNHLRRLWTDSEGWIAGIRLANLALTQPELPLSVRTKPFLARDRFLDDYVHQEALAPLPAVLHDLVLQTAELPFLSGDLCNAMLVIDDGEALLQALHREFSFIAPLNDDSGRYRFNPLVGASLGRLARLIAPDYDAETFRRRAADWYAGRGYLRESAEISLKSTDETWISEMMAPLCRHLAERSEFEELDRWLTRLPESVFCVNLELPYWRIISRLGMGRPNGVDALLATATPSWNGSGEAIWVGRTMLCRGVSAFLMGRESEAEPLLTEALEMLPEEALPERLYAATFVGKIAFRRGDDIAAGLTFGKAEAFAMQLPLDEQWCWTVIASDRGNAYALRGDLFSAITKYRLIISELPPYLAELEGQFRCRVVSLLIERDDLAAARADIEKLEMLAQGEFREWHHDLVIAKVRFFLASGLFDQAEQLGANYVKKLRRHPRKEQLVLLLAQIWLVRGELPLVKSWLSDIGMPEHPWVQTFGDINHLSLSIDLHLAEGAIDRAESLAQSLSQRTAKTLRWSEFVGFTMRWALALHKLGDLEKSRSVVRRAAEAGVRGGFARSFHMAGYDLANVFNSVWSEKKEYLVIKQALLSIANSPADALSDALTNREIEIIQLVALGRSNQQMAVDLYISINTVRNHLANIFRKLSAGSRSEAVARARQTGILN